MSNARWLQRNEACAFTEARQGKNSRDEISTRQKELLAAPTEERAAESLYDAEVATFNNNNVVSEFMQSGRQKLKNVQDARLARLARRLR